MTSMHQALIYLIATLIAVPLFTWLGLGAVLGSLCAGMVIGPYGLNLAGDVENVLALGELGVVFLLFILGLELQPERLWGMRRQVFGLGGAQVGLCTLALALVATCFGLSGGEALLVGVALSLSSTAFALQLLGERKELATPHGRGAFAILLFQDLAVIMLLALMPLLTGDKHLAAGQPLAMQILKVIAVLAAVVSSKWVLRPLLRVVASQRSHTLFTAASLLVVIGIAEAVKGVGLSTALGAFLAGMLFADSEYRHALEADIDPFKGLLLGLFFTAVGMAVNLERVVAQPGMTLLMVLGIVAIKAAILYGIGRRALGDRSAAFKLSLSISQGGEFAFVIFGQAVSQGAISTPLSELLIAAVTLTMATTPILFFLFERFVAPRLGAAEENRAFDVSPSRDTPVIIAGFGRMGQVVGRILRGLQIPFTALDNDAERIDFITRFGAQVFYGDASRVEMLRAARADAAQVFVLCVSDVSLSVRCAATVKAHFPHLKIIARARDRAHAYRLMELGVDRVIRETFHASLEISSQVLEGVGLTYSDGQAAIDRFQEHDEALLKASLEVKDDEKALMAMARAAREELEQLFEQDAPARDQRSRDAKQ
jgi:monovalent cation:proton antiporter-2 (CPA2) family protein